MVPLLSVREVVVTSMSSGEVAWAKKYTVPARGGIEAHESKPSLKFAASGGVMVSSSSDMHITPSADDAEVRELLDSGCWVEAFVPVHTGQAESCGFYVATAYFNSHEEASSPGNSRLAHLVTKAAARKGRHIPHFLSADFQRHFSAYGALGAESGFWHDATSIVPSADTGMPTFCNDPKWNRIDVVPGSSLIDGILTNTAGRNMVQSFRLDRSLLDIPGHLCLEITLNISKVQEEAWHWISPKAIPLDDFIPYTEGELDDIARQVWMQYSASYAEMVASEDAQTEWELINRAAEDYLLTRAGIPLTDKRYRGRGLTPKFDMKPIATLSADAQGAITEEERIIRKAIRQNDALVKLIAWTESNPMRPVDNSHRYNCLKRLRITLRRCVEHMPVHFQVFDIDAFILAHAGVPESHIFAAFTVQLGQAIKQHKVDLSQKRITDWAKRIAD